MEPTINIALDKSYKIKKGPDAGKYHAKIWVTFISWKGDEKVWDQHPYKTGIFVTEKEFAALMENDPKKRTRIERLKEFRRQLDDKKNRAEEVIRTYKVNTKIRFDQYFRDGDVKPESLVGQFQIKIQELRKPKKGQPRLSNAEKYESTLKSLQEYFGTQNVTFQMCTPEALHGYEEWYTDPEGKNRSLTTVGINMRNLRHIFKRAIKQKIISENLYPFRQSDDDDSEDRYLIPEGDGDGTHQFLDAKKKDEFLAHRFTAFRCDHCGAFVRKKSRIFPICPWCRAGSLQEVDDQDYNELHDYAVFSYFAHGLNASDIFRMRKSHVHDDYIVLNRQKTTSRKKKRAKLHTIPMHPRMREIIQRRGTKTLGIPDAHVFPQLQGLSDEASIRRVIKRMVDRINDMLGAMADQLGWDFGPTMYTIRHTFAYHYIQLGATTEQLQFALAHGSIKTTEVYKHGFSIESQKKLSDGLG